MTTELTDEALRTTATEVIAFWFQELTPKAWWTKDPALDEQIRARFSSVHALATRAELFSWRETAAGRLAEVLVLDQFSRNMFRDRAEAFASDPLALALAQEAVRAGSDRDLEDKMRPFLYMPFMHSESRRVHVEAERLFGTTQVLEFELKHKAIVDRFGRYPHRNAILGRESTNEEIAFLKEPGSSF